MKAPLIKGGQGRGPNDLLNAASMLATMAMLVVAFALALGLFALWMHVRGAP
jgi:hypothetical protein